MSDILFQRMGVITAKEAATLIGVSRATLYRWEASPELEMPERVRVGKRTGFRREDLQHWLNSMGGSLAEE